MVGQDGTAARLRAGLLLLVVVGVAGTALALAYERHWLSPWQLAPWITLGIVSVATTALLVRPVEVTVRLARAVAVLTIVSAAFGTWQHIDTNLNTDPTADHHAASGAKTATSAQDSDRKERTAGDDHHADKEEQKADDHHHAGDKEETANDGHHADEERSSSEGEGHAAAEEDATSPSPSFADVVIGSVGHAPIPAALSLAPIGLALGLATIGLGGARAASRE